MNQFPPNMVYTIANGASSTNPFVEIFETRDPTQFDVNYPIQKRWYNTLTNIEFILVGFTSIGGVLEAVWMPFSAQGALLRVGVPNGDTPVEPDSNGLLNFTSNDASVTITGTDGGLNAQDIDFSVGPTVAITYQTDSGSATPAANILNVIGGGGATTSGSGNTITVTAESSFIWSTITASQILVANNGYFCISPGGALTLALPSVGSTVIGQEIKVTLDGATSFQITQAASQQIHIGSSNTTTGAGGSITTTASGDTIHLVAQSSTRWNAISWVGSLTVV